MASQNPSAAIQSSTHPKRTPANVVRAIDPPVATPAPPVQPQASPSRADSRALKVPAEIAQHFVRVGDDFHSQEGEHVFRVRDRTLATRMDTMEVVSTLIAVMKSNGVQTLEVTEGSHRFRQRLWRAGIEAGVTVQGYSPTAFERAKYLDPREQSAGVHARPATAAEHVVRESSITPATVASIHDLITAPIAPSVLHTGQLIAHGHAPEQFAANGGPSYYLTLLTSEGERPFWDPDLERAFADSETKPQRGNTIGVLSIPLKELFRDPEKVVRGEPEQSSDKKYWIVEKGEFFSTRKDMAATLRDRDVPAYKALEKYPDLMGAYGTLLVVAEAALRYEVDPQRRRMWVGGIRDGLADRIARGDPLPRVPYDRQLKAAVMKEHDPPKREPLVRG